MAEGDKFMRFKKIICGMMTAVLCISVMSINASADVIGTAKRETEGGSSGTMEARVIAEKSYLTPSSGGQPFSYRYVTTADYKTDSCIADKWELTGRFYYEDTYDTKFTSSEHTNAVFISKTLDASAEQYILGEFTGKAKSTSFGDVVVTLNVAY